MTSACSTRVGLVCTAVQVQVQHIVRVRERVCRHHYVRRKRKNNKNILLYTGGMQ